MPRFPAERRVGNLGLILYVVIQSTKDMWDEPSQAQYMYSIFTTVLNCYNTVTAV